jgi:hypothetical protein
VSASGWDEKPFSSGGVNPNRKLRAVGVLIVYLLGLFGLDVPEEVAAALVVLIGAIGTLVGGKVVSPDTAARFQKTRGVLD